MSTLLTEIKNLGLHLPAFILASALTVTGCGGSSSNSDDGSGFGGNNTPTFGQSGDNECLIENTNEVDLACYLVPGKPGEEPTLTYATYVREDGKFVRASSGNNPWGISNGETVFSWKNIAANAAEYDQLGTTTYFEWDETDDTIIQIDGKGLPDEDKLTRPLTPVIGAEETVTSTSEGDTIIGSLMVFAPKARTVKVPGTEKTIETLNAIMVVQIADMGMGLGLVSVEHYVPGFGGVALTHYMGCPDVANLDFRDDAAYYETKCASSDPMLPSLDWSWILNKKGDSPAGDSGTPGSSGPGDNSSSIATLFHDALGSGNYTLTVGITPADGGDAINETVTNVALPASELEMCNKLQAKAISVITDGLNYTSPMISCAWSNTPAFPYDQQGIIQYFPYGQAVFSWEAN